VRTLNYIEVDDKGALPPRVLRSRHAKEANALSNFWAGISAQVRSLEALHTWINTQHAAYAFTGFTKKKALNLSSALAQTY
jgi:hypothetical protein